MGSTKGKEGLRTSGMGSTTRNGVEDRGDGVYQGKTGMKISGWGLPGGNGV